MNLPITLKSDEFNLNVNFEITNVLGIAEQIPTEILLRVLRGREHSVDIADVEDSELLRELESRIKEMPSDIFRNTVVPTIKKINTEQLGLFLIDRSDRIDVLCNYTEKELLTELYSRDSDFAFELEDRQATQIVRNILRNEPPHEAAQEMLEYCKEHFEATDLVDFEDMVRDMDDSEVVEMAVEKVGVRSMLAPSWKAYQTNWRKFMANNYVQSCVCVNLGSNEAAKAAFQFYSLAESYINDFDEGEDAPTIESPAVEEWEVFLCAIAENEVISFNCYVQGKEIYIGSEEFADPEHMAYFIQFIQKHFNLNEPVLITWAETCSKLREGEFNGGCAIVHKDLIKFRNSSYDWFNQVCKEYNIARDFS